MARIDLSLYPEQIAHNLDRVRQKGIIIPTLAQQQNPEELVPQKSKTNLKALASGIYIPKSIQNYLEKRDLNIMAAIWAPSTSSNCHPVLHRWMPASLPW